MNEKKYLALLISYLLSLTTLEKMTLLNAVKSLEDFFNLSTDDISYIIKRSLKTKKISKTDFEKKLNRALRLIDVYKIDMTCIGDSEYPKVLHKITNPPFIIFSRGAKIDDKKKIAIVGTRKPTTEAIKYTLELSRDISKLEYVVVSGLAYGIDSFAHRATLESNGKTIAVLPSGLESIYPQSNSQLALRILESGGSIISEYPPGVEPLKYRFLERNRIVSAISEAVIVVEAPERSGALSTASHAMRQGKPVIVLEQLLNSEQNMGAKKLEAHIISSLSQLEHVLVNAKSINTELFFSKGDCV